MGKVLGRNVIVYVYDGGDWKPYACGRSVSLTVSTEMIETSVSGSGVWSTFAPVKHSWTATIDGIVSLEESGQITLPELREKQYDFQSMQIRYQRTSVESEVYTESGVCYITNSTDSASFDDLNLFNIELVGTGPLSQVYDPTPNLNGKMYRHEFTGGSGTTYVNAALINKDVIEVVRDGIGYSKLKLTGSPVDKEVIYTAASGTFTWAIPLEPGEEGYITYQNM